MPSERLRYRPGAASIIPLDSVQCRARDAIDAKIANGIYGTRSHICPTCDGRDFESLASRDRYGIKYNAVACISCGLVQADPYLDDEALNDFYQTEFPSLHRSSPEPTMAKFQSRRAYAAGIVKWFRKHGITSKGLVLDVGCSSGGILQGFVDAGFEGAGVELNHDYAQFARSRGLQVFTGTLAEVELAATPKLITYCQVLEHVPDIKTELLRLQEFGRRNCLVYIEVPGIKQLWPGYHFDFLRYLQLAHIWHFSLESLSRLMARYGFAFISGDQYVHALFRYDPDKATAQAELSDYDAVKRSLARSDLWRRAYPLATVQALSRLSKMAGLRQTN